MDASGFSGKAFNKLEDIGKENSIVYFVVLYVLMIR